MKSFIISTSLLLAAVSSTLAAPLSNSRIPKLRVRPRSLLANATLPIAEDPNDPSAKYIVVLADDEKRKWADVFDEMGFNTNELKDHKDGFYAFGASSDDHGFRTFALEDGTSIQTFGTAMRAFTMTMFQSEAEGMKELPNIAVLEKDFPVGTGLVEESSYEVASIPDEPVNITEYSVSGLDKRQQQGQVVQQNGAPWNLERISETRAVSLRGRGVTQLAFNYAVDSNGGTGVDVYMVDTGINVNHVEFGGRAKMIFSAFGQNNLRDDHFHGTHTAGTVGSRRYGVAKNVNLFGIKALDSNNRGTGASIVAGMEAALAAHLRRVREPNFIGSVMSMSIGGGGSQAQFNVLQRMAQAGMHVSISAMNDNKDACSAFPGGYSRQLPIFNVGATDPSDGKASFSNFGPCVNIHAPGTNILSTNSKDNQSSRVLQGTSMACPAVSGVIALEIVKNPNLRRDPRAMIQHIQSLAIRTQIRGANSAQIMLNNGVKR
ncbi:Aqualysin-1 [Drechslerella dactyloides]|uniref:Aqualysin-1 n=1 Tax=Drechslerella dactyloides TaxID=74499 RepID=A0AAD6J5K2_DREDA|nr:Aqualysin-1 [Drechslerella dactyloides]